MMALIAGLYLCAFAQTAFTVYLYLLMRRDLYGEQQESAGQRSKLIAALNQQIARSVELEERLVNLEMSTGMLVAPPVPRSGMNLSNRSQAIRLHRMGTSSEEIAGTLGIPRREVELLLKVHQLVLASY